MVSVVGSSLTALALQRKLDEGAARTALDRSSRLSDCRRT
jgi:hypothetical protein